jgi:transposase InsO family protein
VKYAWITAHRALYGVKVMCRVLEVSVGGYFGSLKRPVSRRTRANETLSARIRVTFADSKGRYGSPRLYRELTEAGIPCGRNRVARLMRIEGLRARAARKFRATTDSHHALPIAPDKVERRFTATKPDAVWVGDMTYLRTRHGWLYLAVFIDLFSRRVVGWALAPRMSAELVVRAFERAVARRRPPAGLVVHSDRGAQYASALFRAALREVSAVQSMGSTGDCYDNAVAESFFHSFKVEAIHGADIVTAQEMEYQTFDYIERFYNPVRRHSALNYCSPEQFERGFKLTRKEVA